MPVFLREHDSGAYRVSSYFFGRTVVGADGFRFRFVFVANARKFGRSAFIYMSLLL